MKCDCGGTLSPRRLPTFDFTPFAGIRCELRKVPGLRCGRCAYKTIGGEAIRFVLNILSLHIAQSPARLSKELAVFLRKRLGLTQQELADRMGINRETVARWECGTHEVSVQNDSLLRTIFLSSLVGQQSAERIVAALATLGHVRAEPPQPPAPFVIEKELAELRNVA